MAYVKEKCRELLQLVAVADCDDTFVGQCLFSGFVRFCVCVCMFVCAGRWTF